MPNAKIAVRLAGLSLVSLLMVCTLVSVTYAQAPSDRKEGARGSTVESQGKGGPSNMALDEFTVLYTFSGARDTQYYDADTTPINSAATVVHCTNAGSDLVQLRVEIYDFNDRYTLSVTEAIDSNYTLTFSTQDTWLYYDDAIITRTQTVSTSNIDQGSGRIMVDNPSAKIVCTAQVLDPLGNPPSYVVKLTLYDAYGNFAGDKRTSVFLPVILKQ
jgi:hypothetical protein